MSQIRRAGFVVLAVGLVITGCARPEPSDFEASSAGVRFERANADGLLVESALVEDPKRETYGKTAWPASQASSVSVVQGAPGKNRVNFVFVGDGYTSDELSSYASDVKRSVTSLLKEEPFKTYRNYFSFVRVDVVSNESGVTTAGGRARRTALEMEFGCAGLPRLLCANLERVVKEAKNAGLYDVIFAVANSDDYGGAGYLNPKVATFAGKNSSSFELALHELGHSFGGLGDEYEQAGVEGECLKFSNVADLSREQMRASKTKWYQWLDLPNVGTFAGACYGGAGLYRPTQASKMRVLGKPYEEVNTEQLIRKIYEKVRPVDSATASGTYSSSGSIWIKPMKLEGRELKIRWTLNGKRLSQYDGKTSIALRELGLTGASKRTLAVTVYDDTLHVRDERSRETLMKQTLTWKVRK